MAGKKITKTASRQIRSAGTCTGFGFYQSLRRLRAQTTWSKASREKLLLSLYKCGVVQIKSLG